MKRYLLDTCTFLWFVSDDKKLPDMIRREISLPANVVYLSPASLWEAVLKQQLGRITFPADAATYLRQLRIKHGIQSLSIDEDCLLHLGKLPALHRDPFDRILVCQSLEHGLTILTPDEAIHRYPAKVLWE